MASYTSLSTLLEVELDDVSELLLLFPFFINGTGKQT